MSGIGERLRSIRHSLGFSQDAMSERFGLGIGGWKRLEKEGRAPKDEVLQALANAGVNLNWLLTGCGEAWREPHDTSQAGVDTDILRNCIKVLHEELQRRHVTLTPAQQAEAISLLYDLSRPEPGQEAKPVDRNIVVRLLRMVG